MTSALVLTGAPGAGKSARELAELGTALDGIDLVLDTDERDAEDVARAVLAAMRERELL